MSVKSSLMNHASKIQSGGIRKKNGHKETCSCPICKNMMHAKGAAGYDVATPSSSSRKKSNGHKANCGCPICKNMKKGKGKNVTMKGGKKSNGHKNTCGCPICKNMKKNQKHGGDEDVDEEVENDTMSSSAEEMSNDTTSSSDEDGTSSSSSMGDDSGKESSPDLLGGKKKSNGHKSNCGCPICKNMKKGKGKSKNVTMKGGKKSNGHKATCGCPICKNMKNKKRSKRM